MKKLMIVSAALAAFAAQAGLKLGTPLQMVWCFSAA